MWEKIRGAFTGIFLVTNFLILGTAEADNLDSAMEDALNKYNVRGASIAYFNQKTLSEPVFRSYGKVSSSDDSREVTPDTVFMIASTSKLFTGTAVLKLVDQGIIDLDDNICNVIPNGYSDSACKNPSWPNTPVTWKMLVTHTSSLIEGIPTINKKEASYGPTGGYRDGTAIGNPTCPLTDVVGFYRDFMTDKETETSVGSGIKVDWFQVASDDGGAWEDVEPGTQSLYSNFATGYIAALIELASGKSFPDYCKENIFDPLGMENTAWFRKDLSNSVLETLPVEYDGENQSFSQVDHYCFIDYASGSLRTTAKDMAKFLDSMLDYGAPKLWASDVIGKIGLSCAEGNTVKNECQFGVTWVLFYKDEAEEFGLEPALNLDWSHAAGHDGAELGSQTQVALFPEAGVYAVVFTNTDGNDDMAAQMLMKEVLSKASGLLGDDEFTSHAPKSYSSFSFFLFVTIQAIVLVVASKS